MPKIRPSNQLRSISTARRQVQHRVDQLHVDSRSLSHSFATEECDLNGAEGGSAGEKIRIECAGRSSGPLPDIPAPMALGDRSSTWLGAKCMARAVRCKTEAPRPTNVRAATMYQASNVEHLLRAIMGIVRHLPMRSNAIPRKSRASGEPELTPSLFTITRRGSGSAFRARTVDKWAISELALFGLERPG